MHLLVVEDDERLAAALATALEAAGFIVEREVDGEMAWYRGENEAFDAVLLDLGLPTTDGLTVLKRWRNAGRNYPVLILTARGQWEERVEGIEAGADDYLVKPFRIEEVVARVRALIRRSKGQPSSRITFAGLVLDTQLMRVSRDGVPVPLTPQEYRLLTYLTLNRGRVVPKVELTEHIYPQALDREPNAIEVLVGRLRRRVGADVIKTHRGFGYVVEGDRE
jgi:two-component system, OmpR family, response regulator